MKTEVEGESTGSWTPIVRRSSLDDFRRSLQSFQDSFEGLNAAESPLQTPITTTQITCSKYAHFANSLSICLKKDGRHSQRLESGLDPLKRVFGRCRSQQSGTNRDATYKTRAVSDRYMFHAFFRLLSSSLVESSSIDSSSAVVCTNKVQIKSECIVQGIYKCVCSGEDYMECFMPRDGFFAPMYDTVVSPIRYNLEQARGLTTSYWPTFNDGFYFPSQEDNASLTTQGTFLNTPFDEMEALTGRNLHNRCFTASKSCPSSLQPISTVLTPPGQKQMLRRVRSEKTHLMTPIKKRMNKSKQRPTQTMIKYEHNTQNWKTNRKQRTSKRRTLVRSSSQDSEIANNGQSPPGASVGRGETRARSTFADMVRDNVIKTGPQIWSVGHDANIHVFVKPNGNALQPSSLSTV